MKLKMLTDKEIFLNNQSLNLEKGKLYEIEDVIQDTYKIKVPMKQKDKFRYVLIKEDEGELVD